ncbi:MAG: hypothetical protein ACRD1H_04490 [Vicinamibacterales bacterium]
MTRLPLVVLLCQAAVQTPAPAPIAGNQTPTTNASPSTPGTPDPAAVTFTTGMGLLFVTVTPAKAADYDAAIIALQDALARSEDAEIRAMAGGWRVFKAAEKDAKSNLLYVHVLQPAVAGTDYRPSLWLDKLLGGAPPELLAKYRDAFAGAPSKLSLVEFAHMAIAPVGKPSNASPAVPTPPGLPGNVTPAKPGNSSPPPR